MGVWRFTLGGKNLTTAFFQQKHISSLLCVGGEDRKKIERWRMLTKYCCTI